MVKPNVFKEIEDLRNSKRLSMKKPKILETAEFFETDEEYLAEIMNRYITNNGLARQDIVDIKYQRIYNKFNDTDRSSALMIYEIEVPVAE